MKKLLALFVSLLSLASSANAGLITLDFDAANPGVLLRDPYHEDGFTLRLTGANGHYDFFNDGSGGYFFNTDGGGGTGTFGFGKFSLTRDDGALFDVESFVVFGELSGRAHTLSVVGNSGTIIAPSGPGPFVLDDSFHGATEFLITQTFAGFFGFDDLVLRVPSAVSAPATPLLMMLALIYRRIRGQTTVFR